jgi:Prion-inhibition and propagation
LLVKLDCEKARLLTWGNTMAILHTRNEGRLSQLDEPESEKLIHRCMTQVIDVLTNGESFKMNTEADQLYREMARTGSMSA